MAKKPEDYSENYYEVAIKCLNEQNKALNEALGTGYEALEYGIETTIMLNEDIEQTKHINNRMYDVDAEVSKANRVLDKILFGIFGDAFVQYGIMICCAIIIVAIVFFEWVLPLI